ncbi:MAG: YebC/PmpR family DNA-binding transcriptional regulator [Oligoflexia bacterium]|nr:YebC/PmpR family DNA-binding transcriptional regulator [Oligoflexia bacterium]
MGRSWIQGYKNIQAAKKGNVFTKLSKEITVAARLGGGDPDGNARLRAAMVEARANSMPRDNIERAVKKGTGTLEGVNYEDVIYEGYGPHGVAIIVEALTDNRNRTVSEIKILFRDYDGNLGEIGSVSWMFNRIGIIEGTKNPKPSDLEGEAIEVGAQAVEEFDDGTVSFSTESGDLGTVAATLTARGWTINKSEFAFDAKTPVDLGEAEKKQVVELLGELSGHDDVRRVHAALS